MNLTKKSWNKSDVKEYREYIYSLSGSDKQKDFEKRIANTKMPCLAVPSKTVDLIVKEIAKGDFYGFLKLKILEYHTDFLIYGKIICKIKDFEERKKLLTDFSERADSWAHTDCLYLKAKKSEEKRYMDFAKELLKSEHVFSRRLAYIIMLKNLNCNNVDEILKTCGENRLEKEYYVNMAIAWLVAECFIKFKEKTFVFFKEKRFGDFVNDKAISKCIDSYRVNDLDKELLKNYRTSKRG